MLLLQTLGKTANMHVTAQIMNLTQPAASKMLNEIELIFEFPIFVRTPKGMYPTERGLDVLNHAEFSLKGWQRFMADMLAKTNNGYGSLRIGSIAGASPGVLSPAIVAIKKKYPQLNLYIKEHTSDKLLDALEHQELDLAIARFSSIYQQDVFNFEALGSEELWLLASANHPLVALDNMNIKDAINYTWVMQPHSCPMRQLTDRLLLEYDPSEPLIPLSVVETSSIFVTLQLVQESEMLTIRPRSCVAQYVQHGILARLPIDFNRQLENYGILTHKEIPLNDITLQFIECLRNFSNLA